jgi:hypothetical protein
MINRENYEIFFMDYLDGQLSSEQLEALDLFLENNPDLKEELEDLSGFKLKAGEHTFPDKALLKKTPDLPEVNKDNIQAYLLHQLEGNLNKDERAKLTAFLTLHPNFSQEKEIWAQTKLSADESIKMDKSSLIIFNDEQDFEGACIAYLEDDLSDDDKIAFEALIKDNTAALGVFNSFQKSVIVAPDVVFEDKKSLKKSEGKVIPIWWKSAAAIAAIFLVGWLVLPDFDRARTKQTAKPTKELQPEENDMALINDQDTVKISVENDDMSPLITDDVIPSIENDMVIAKNKTPKTPQPKQQNYIPELQNNPGSDLAETKINIKQVPFKPELLPIDSILNTPIDLKLNLTKQDDNIAMNENPLPPSSNALSVKEAVAKSISTRVTEEPSEYDTDLNYAALNTLGKITNNEVDYKKDKDSDRAVTSFSIGKFGFYRSKKKK